jgi:RNA polymerase sigma-70 factor (ECF subfamily)
MNDMRWNDPVPAPASEPDSALAELERFRAEYHDTLPHVYGYLLHRLGGDAALAEDLTQETYVAAVCDMRRRGEATALSVPWLIAVARHKLVDHFRRLAREERKLTLVSADAPGPSWGHWLDGPATDVLIGLAALPPLQRAAVALRYLDDLPVAEVARLLGRSVHATESLLARGRDGLRRRHREHADE